LTLFSAERVSITHCKKIWVLKLVSRSAASRRVHGAIRSGCVAATRGCVGKSLSVTTSLCVTASSRLICACSCFREFLSLNCLFCPCVASHRLAHSLADWRSLSSNVCDHFLRHVCAHSGNKAGAYSPKWLLSILAQAHLLMRPVVITHRPGFNFFSTFVCCR
jgi:hypothetical protein